MTITFWEGLWQLSEGKSGLCKTWGAMDRLLGWHEAELICGSQVMAMRFVLVLVFNSDSCLTPPP